MTGASAVQTGLSLSAEPVPVSSANVASIPSADERLVHVLSDGRQRARAINAELARWACQADAMGSTKLADALLEIGDAVTDMANVAWQAHGHVIDQRSSETYAGIARILNAVLPTSSEDK